MSDWLPDVQRLPASHRGGTMLVGPPRVVWHRTAGGNFDSNAAYLKAKGFEPHLLWDPHSGQLGQFLPASRSAYAVRRDVLVPTNRAGVYCIQIEVVDRGNTWAVTDTPMLGLDRILAWVRSLGVPDAWPAGAPCGLGQAGNRSRSLWLSKGGHYGHCHVPGNDHTDPGPMDLAKLFGDTERAAPAVAIIPTDRIGAVMADFPVLHTGTTSPDVRTVQGLCVARGHQLAVDGAFGPGTLAAVKAVQQRYGLLVDGIVGEKTWRALLGR